MSFYRTIPFWWDHFRLLHDGLNAMCRFIWHFRVLNPFCSMWRCSSPFYSYRTRVMAFQSHIVVIELHSAWDRIGTRSVVDTDPFVWIPTFRILSPMYTPIMLSAPLIGRSTIRYKFIEIRMRNTASEFKLRIWATDWELPMWKSNWKFSIIYHTISIFILFLFPRKTQTSRPLQNWENYSWSIPVLIEDCVVVFLFMWVKIDRQKMFRRDL